ncbi:hypothetical protein BIW11_06145 [Tropilaelaps mercedesae]|uniref:Uncharacterized protein n=1 Tax=Tropilaelaps mercedesae TaxID=418985 RepID=A0A1V9XZB2_9ACAR|nr:hypothetical protein BIW11_06145 [Tropilaelaps mercedesae]
MPGTCAPHKNLRGAFVCACVVTSDHHLWKHQLTLLQFSVFILLSDGDFNISRINEIHLVAPMDTSFVIERTAKTSGEQKVESAPRQRLIDMSKHFCSELNSLASTSVHSRFSHPSERFWVHNERHIASSKYMGFAPHEEAANALSLRRPPWPIQRHLSSETTTSSKSSVVV